MPRGTIVTTIDPPSAGARSDLPPHKIPAESVDANFTTNVILRDGSLVNRPGFAQITPALVTGVPRGGFYFKLTDGSAQTIIGTTLGWYRLNTTTTPPSWTDLTGGVPLTGSVDDAVEFVVWPIGVALQLIGVNRTDPPKVYTGAGVYTNLGGSPPPAGDITVSTNRVILVDTLEGGVRQVYRVRWSDFNDSGTWPAANFADLSDTEDPIVAAKALTRTAFAIYKQQSQWVGFAQAGLSPFRFELQDLKAGPASPYAVVNADGKHWYLGQDGSIYVFDGIRTTHIGEAIRRWIVTRINFAQLKRCFSVFLRRDRDVYFFFPSAGSTSCDTVVSVNIDSGRFFPHNLRIFTTTGFAGNLVATLTWNPGLVPFTWTNLSATYPTWLSMGSGSTPVEIIGDASSLIHNFGIASTDNGATPSAMWRFGPLKISQGKRVRVQSLESYFQQAPAAQTVVMQVGTTDTLKASPVFPTGMTKVFDASVADSGTDAAVIKVDTDQMPGGVGTGTAEARFIAVQHQVATVTEWTYFGSELRSYEQETS